MYWEDYQNWSLAILIPNSSIPETDCKVFEICAKFLNSALLFDRETGEEKEEFRVCRSSPVVPLPRLVDAEIGFRQIC